MHLIIDGLTINAGGARFQLCSFANFAHSQGHKVTFACVDREAYFGRIADGVQLECPQILRLAKRLHPLRLPVIALWRGLRLPKLLRAPNSVVFNPNGIVPKAVSRSGPCITMSQNMLPFDEAARLGFDRGYRIKLQAIRWVQRRSFRRATGVVFISEYAARRIQESAGRLAQTVTIPLGVPDNFVDPSGRGYRIEGTAKIVYVSDLLPYKHHSEVIEGIARLCSVGGAQVEAEFIGQSWKGSLERLQRQVQAAGLAGHIRFSGPLDRRELANALRRADLALFASSCENCPTTLIEKMRAGLPIGCSKMGPMPEVLGDGGRYFDPRLPEGITAVLADLLARESERVHLGRRAYERSLRFNTEAHNRALIEFISVVAKPDGDPKGVGRN